MIRPSWHSRNHYESTLGKPRERRHGLDAYKLECAGIALQLLLLASAKRALLHIYEHRQKLAKSPGCLIDQPPAWWRGFAPYYWHWMPADRNDDPLRDPITVLMKLMPFFFPLSQTLVIQVPQSAQPSHPMLCIQRRLERTHRSD